MYRIDEIDWQMNAKAISDLRVHVWRPLALRGSVGESLTELIEALDSDRRTTHICSLLGSVLVGAVRITRDYLPESITTTLPESSASGSAYLSRLVVDPNHRLRGIAKALELACVEKAANDGMKALWVEASPTTAGAMQRIGFELCYCYKEQVAIFVPQEIAVLRKPLSLDAR